ncbi:membrane-spanning 4-domains subfamily A member 8-like [Pholidichthys leucotaenia]
MSASATATATAGSGVYVVTHVVPAPQAAAPQTAPERSQFVHRKPAALGTVQIMIGIVVFLFGMVWIPNPTLGAVSGIFVWGAAFFITAGSLTVAAGKSLNRCLVNTALGFSVWAAITAASGTIIYGVDAFIGPLYHYCDSSYCYYDNSTSAGVGSVLAIFCFLELIISIFVAATFCCVNNCCCPDQSPPMIIINQPVHPASVTMEAPPAYNFPAVSEMVKPTEYNTNITG